LEEALELQASRLTEVKLDCLTHWRLHPFFGRWKQLLAHLVDAATGHMGVSQVVVAHAIWVLRRSHDTKYLNLYIFHF